MIKLSSLINTLMVSKTSHAAATLKTCTIDGTGAVTVSAAGTDLVVTTAVGTTPSGQFIADKVWNAVWNDLADFQVVIDEVIPGKCYFDSVEGARICNKRCQMGVIGVASDTFGYALGGGGEHKKVPIGVAGWVLAFVDKVYETGTPLTNDENGHLTEMSMEEKRDFPERLVGTYKKPEYDQFFGTNNNTVPVNGRHWIHIK